MMPEYERLKGNTWDSLTTPEDYHREVQKLKAENEVLKTRIKGMEEAIRIYKLLKGE